MLVGDLVYNDNLTATVTTRSMTVPPRMLITTVGQHVFTTQSGMATGNPLMRSLICRSCI